MASSSYINVARKGNICLSRTWGTYCNQLKLCLVSGIWRKYSIQIVYIRALWLNQIKIRFERWFVILFCYNTCSIFFNLKVGMIIHVFMYDQQRFDSSFIFFTCRPSLTVIWLLKPSKLPSLWRHIFVSNQQEICYNNLPIIKALLFIPSKSQKQLENIGYFREITYGLWNTTTQNDINDKDLLHVQNRVVTSLQTQWTFLQ